MPLSQNTLNTEFNKLLNPNSKGFYGYATNGQDVAEKWGTVLLTYVKNNIFPLSLTYDEAFDAFVEIFKGVSYKNPSAFDLLEQSIRVFCLVLGNGMIGYYPPIINPNKIFIKTIPIGISSTLHLDYINALSNDIHTWMLVNTSNNFSGITVNWI